MEKIKELSGKDVTAMFSDEGAKVISQLTLYTFDVDGDKKLDKKEFNDAWKFGGQ